MEQAKNIVWAGKTQWTMVLEFNGSLFPLPLVSADRSEHLSGYLNNFVSQRKTLAAQNATKIAWPALVKTGFADVFASLMKAMADHYQIKIVGNKNVFFVKNFVFYDTVLLREESAGVFTVSLNSVLRNYLDLKLKYPKVYDIFVDIESKLCLKRVIAYMKPCQTYSISDVSGWSGHLYLKNGIYLEPFREGWA